MCVRMCVRGRERSSRRQQAASTHYVRAHGVAETRVCAVWQTEYVCVFFQRCSRREAGLLCGLRSRQRHTLGSPHTHHTNCYHTGRTLRQTQTDRHATCNLVCVCVCVCVCVAGCAPLVWQVNAAVHALFVLHACCHLYSPCTPHVPRARRFPSRCVCRHAAFLGERALRPRDFLLPHTQHHRRWSVLLCKPRFARYFKHSGRISA